MNTEAIFVVLHAKENKEKGEGASVEGRGVSFIRYGGKPAEESRGKGWRSHGEA